MNLRDAVLLMNIPCEHEHLIREARATVERLAQTLIEVKKDIEENAEDTLWVHGGMPMTICDRIDIELAKIREGKA